MAKLDPLIRMRKHLVEQKQKFLADLYRQAEELQAKRKALQDELEFERKAVTDINSVEAVIYFGRYSEVIKGRIEDIGEAIVKLDVRIEVAREDIRTAFADLKKIEITHARREDDEEKKRDKKESNMLDDIAIEGFRRNSEDN